MPVTVRGSRLTYVNNTNTIAFTLPAGSVAGDTCFILAGHGFGFATPSGWIELDSEGGTNVSGAVFWKNLDAADIATGTVTINFTGTYYGIVSGITFVGSVVISSNGQFNRTTSGAGPRTLTESYADNGDYAVYFCHARFNSTITPSRGASLQSSSNLNASGVLYGETLSASVPISQTFTFGATPTGDYEALIIVHANDGSTTVKENELTRHVLLTPVGTLSIDELSRLTLMTKANATVNIEELARLTLADKAGSQANILELNRLTLWSGVAIQLLNVHELVRLTLITVSTSTRKRAAQIIG